ncbi:ROK family protein [Paenibacillus sp. 1P07SE]|uniref:ROK family protein n=1 Tax=Paenibacillus sp. 1P07SE TaxID=3132209 RepID=UPI0039A54EA1
MTAYAFGFDIGGTNTQSGLVSEEGALLWMNSVRTEAHMGNEHVMELVRQQVELGIRQSGVSREQIAGIGVGMPGAIDPKRGICVQSINLAFRDYPIGDKLQALTSMPVVVENDVRMYVYGEAVCGAGQGYGNVLGLTIGTGVAAAWTQNGEIYRGGGIAGEIGHLRFEELSYRCTCGGTGCLETIVSATGLAHQARQAVRGGERSLMAELHASPELLTAKDVSDAYDQQDPAAIAIMNRTGRYLGKALSYLVQILDPDVIVIGGGGAKAGERLLSPARETMLRLTQPIYHEGLAVVQAARNDESGILGSALWALRQLGKSRKQGY